MPTGTGGTSRCGWRPGPCYTCDVPVAASPALLRAAPGSAGSSATTSPVVTLVPTGRSGTIPGDANDGADFWGIGAALLMIVAAIVIVRLVFRRGTGPPPAREER